MHASLATLPLCFQSDVGHNLQMNSVFHPPFAVELCGNFFFFLMCIACVTSWPLTCRQSRNSVINLDLFGKEIWSSFYEVTDLLDDVSMPWGQPHQEGPMFQCGFGSRGSGQTCVGNNVVGAGMKLTHRGNSKGWNSESDLWLMLNSSNSL